MELIRLRVGAFIALVFILAMLAQPISASTFEYSNYTEDYVDNNTSTLDAVEFGTHSNFENEKASDSTYDTLTESDEGVSGSDVEDFVDQLGTSHVATPDIGTHSDWTELQDADTTYDTLTEADTGGSGVDEDVYVYTAPSPVSETQVGSAPYLQGPMSGETDGNYLTDATNNGYTGWYSFGTTTASGTGLTVSFSFYGGQDDDDDIRWELDWTSDGTADASATLTDPTRSLHDIGVVSGLDTSTEVEACRVRFMHVKGGGGIRTNYYDAAMLNVVQAGGSNYDLDLELGWTNAPYTEDNVELQLYGGTQGAEALRVDIWDEATTNAWVNIITDVAAGEQSVDISSYINSGTVEIRFTDTSDEATAQDTWQIDYVMIHGWTTGTTLYKLDLEVQFTGLTATQYGSTVEYLCIETGAFAGGDSETLSVAIWESSAWQVLDADLTANDWNNISISSYLDATTETFRFLAGSEITDTTQSTFQIDAVLIRTHSYDYTEILYEEVVVDDTYSTSMSASRVLYEEITFSDTYDLASGFQQILYESITISDSIYNVLTAVITLFEEIVMTDTMNTAASFVMILFEAIGLAGVVTKSIVKELLLFESISISETPLLASTFVKVLFESLTVTETISNAPTFSLVLYESITISDFLHPFAQAYQIVLYEGITIGTQTVTLSAAFSKILFESLTITEIPALMGTFIRVLFESITLNETITTAASHLLVLFESIVINDMIDISKVIQLVLYEGLTVAEQIVTSSAFKMVLYESVAISGTIATSAAFSKTLFESFTLDETINTAASHSLTLFEGIIISDQVDSQKVVQLILFESFTISDQITNSASFSLVLMESVVITEQMTRTGTFLIVLFESITIDDSVDAYLTAGLVYLYLYEGITVSENIITAASRIIVLFESVSLSDSITNTISYVLTLGESITLNEQIDTLFSGTWILNLSESFELGENDVWGPYRPVATPTTTTITDDWWNPGGPIGWVTYFNLYAVIALGVLGFAVVFYVQGVEPKKAKGSAPELKLKSGVKMISRKASDVGKRTSERLKGAMPIIVAPVKDRSRKKTVNKRKKKGGVVVRKRSGKPRGKTYTKPKDEKK